MHTFLYWRTKVVCRHLYQSSQNGRFQHLEIISTQTSFFFSLILQRLFCLFFISQTPLICRKFTMFNVFQSPSHHRLNIFQLFAHLNIDRFRSILFKSLNTFYNGPRVFLCYEGLGQQVEK
jgi:hypothetical protein